MNKNSELMEIEMDRGSVEKIIHVNSENTHLLPVFLMPQRNMSIPRRDIDDWWSGRRIPASRGGINQLLWHLKISLDELSEKSLGLSLSDQYWIRPDKRVKWCDVNFFDNDFSEDIGRLLITGDWNGGNLSSPDNTSDGVVKKRWKIINGERCLVKGSSGVPWQAQPFREVFASKMAKILMSAYSDKFVVPYDLLREEEFVYSVCPNFITTDTEYVSFNQINQAYKKPNHVSGYNFCKQFYKEFDFVLDIQMILDYIVLNEDRHFGNFGLIRNVNTGEWVEPAPIFDTGSCLFYDSIRVNRKSIESKPFSKDFEKQIGYVGLSQYKESIEFASTQMDAIFHESFSGCFEDEERISNIHYAIQFQFEKLLSRCYCPAASK
jgi:hypothetical protein